MFCFEVGDGFVDIVQVQVASAESPICLALHRPVGHLLCNRQVLRVVLYGLAKAPLRLICAPKVPVRRAPALVGSIGKLLEYLQNAHLASRRLHCRAGASARSGRSLALVPGLPHFAFAGRRPCGQRVDMSALKFGL